MPVASFLTTRPILPFEDGENPKLTSCPITSAGKSVQLAVGGVGVGDGLGDGVGVGEGVGVGFGVGVGVGVGVGFGVGVGEGVGVGGAVTFIRTVSDALVVPGAPEQVN